MILLLSQTACLLLSEAPRFLDTGPESGPPYYLDSPTELDPSFVSVATGEYALCGVHTDGRLTCINKYFDDVEDGGEDYLFADALGRDMCFLHLDGSTSCQAQENNLESRAPAGSFERLRVSYRSACAMSEEETACWGSNEHGRIDAAPSKPMLDVAYGYDFWVGLNTDGRAELWGDPPSGLDELATQGRFTSVSAKFYQVCLLRQSSQSCWSGNTETGGPGGLRIDNSEWVTCAQSADGTLSCSGNNSDFQASPPPSAFSDFDISDDYGCGVTLEGRIQCWGDQEEFPFE